MKIVGSSLAISTIAALALATSVSAQEPAEDTATPSETSAAEESDAFDPDEMADSLNSAQQLKQTVTLKRSVNGEVIETDKRTVTFDRSQPYRETEAGRTTIENLRMAFDGEALTRTEAFEEAKLDFAIADKNRNGQLSAQEFADLVDSWRNNEVRQSGAPTEEIARQRQYDAFIEEIDPDAARAQTEAFALSKFSFMAGAAETLSLQDYIREYMLDFDSMDANSDMILTDDELLRFRAINRGETIDLE
ncbi:hypothetical protein ABFZ85_03420 [Hyphococcus formosus]